MQPHLFKHIHTLQKSCSGLLLVLFSVLFAFPALAQLPDTLTIVSYNTLNYGRPATGSCPNLLTAQKHTQLRTIVNYLNPDIIGLVKMTSAPGTFSTDTVPVKVLNVNCPNCYAASPYVNLTGYSRLATLYYKKAKFGYLGLSSVYTADPNIEDINMHRLYYKDPDLALTHDTVYLNIILQRLQSNSGGGQNDRDAETAGTTAWIRSHIPKLKNHIIMGDFNSGSATENCISLLVNPTNRALRFNDPANALGDWHNNPQPFAKYLTQSTRLTDPGDCGSTGGLGDRLDHILLSDSLMHSQSGRISYVPGSFKAVGNDGLHTGLALTDPPANTLLPANILTALQGMSNHLPVTLKLAVAPHSLVGINSKQYQKWGVINSQNGLLTFTGLPEGTEYQLKITGTDGRTLCEGALNPSAEGFIFNITSLPQGIYAAVISSNGLISYAYRVVKW